MLGKRDETILKRIYSNTQKKKRYSDKRPKEIH